MSVYVTVKITQGLENLLRFAGSNPVACIAVRPQNLIAVACLRFRT